MSKWTIGLVAFVAIAAIMGQPSEEEKAENKKYGFHCMSQWDGSHPGLVHIVKKNLRDPDSFQHIETRSSPVENGKNKIRMEYRARNGFGGMNVSYAYGVINNENCKLVEWRFS